MMVRVVWLCVCVCVLSGKLYHNTSVSQRAEHEQLVEQYRERQRRFTDVVNEDLEKRGVRRPE